MVEKDKWSASAPHKIHWFMFSENVLYTNNNTNNIFKIYLDYMECIIKRDCVFESIFPTGRDVVMVTIWVIKGFEFYLYIYILYSTPCYVIHICIYMYTYFLTVMIVSLFPLFERLFGQIFTNSFQKEMLASIWCVNALRKTFSQVNLISDLKQ